ncbi:DeoR/GlpR family DNA-binding transcription regulator [Streptococcus fryi]
MLKRERLQIILDKVNRHGLVTVHDIIADLSVSDMTVRRDLDELEKAGQLIRVHGGAQSIHQTWNYEKSNSEKLMEQMAEKKAIAKATLPFINDGETIFIGPGTTIECLAHELLHRNLRIVTNSLPVFNILKESKTIDLILIGGEYREVTGAFVGSLAQQNLTSLKFSKAFSATNAVTKDSVATYSESEGSLQRLALENARESYLLADHTKFKRFDFYDFYETSKFNAIITDESLDVTIRELFEPLAPLIIAEIV